MLKNGNKPMLNNNYKTNIRFVFIEKSNKRGKTF